MTINLYEDSCWKKSINFIKRKPAQNPQLLTGRLRQGGAPIILVASFVDARFGKSPYRYRRRNPPQATHPFLKIAPTQLPERCRFSHCSTKGDIGLLFDAAQPPRCLSLREGAIGIPAVILQSKPEILTRMPHSAPSCARPSTSRPALAPSCSGLKIGLPGRHRYA